MQILWAKALPPGLALPWLEYLGEKEGGFLLRLKDAPENLCLYVFHLLLCPEVISYYIEAWQRKGQSGMSQNEAGSR